MKNPEHDAWDLSQSFRNISRNQVLVHGTDEF